MGTHDASNKSMSVIPPFLPYFRQTTDVCRDEKRAALLEGGRAEVYDDYIPLSLLSSPNISLPHSDNEEDGLEHPSP